MMMVHGSGLVDEYPTISYLADSVDWGYDGQFEENMVVCVESYIGADRGPQGIKLEQQVRITRTGAEVMSKAPIIDALETGAA
jgi:Xaa-Pro aminopeptidase